MHRGLSLAAALACLSVLATGCGAAAGKASSATAVSAGMDDCGTGWTGGHSGRETFALHNTTVAGEEVYLQSPATKKIYLDVEALGSGATRTTDVVLAAGRYRFVCLPADADPVVGKTYEVTGATTVTGATSGLVPVTRDDLLPAVKAYQQWISGRLPTLHRQVVALRDDLAGGDVAAAKRDWLAGHLTYETLGAAYGAFGDDDTRIDGDDEGFHRIEQMLWSGSSATATLPQARALVSAVKHLQQTFGAARVDPVDIGLRAHEIVENALQLELSGSTDEGSHTNLATLDANLDGSREALRPLHAILASRYPQLPATERSLTRAQHLVEAEDHDGRWTPVQHLTRAHREAIDAAVDEATEMLAPVATICDPRRAA